MNSKLESTGSGCMESGCRGKSDMLVRDEYAVYDTESGREVEVIVLKGLIKVKNYYPIILNILQKGW